MKSLIAPHEIPKTSLNRFANEFTIHSNALVRRHQIETAIESNSKRFICLSVDCVFSRLTHGARCFLLEYFFHSVAVVLSINQQMRPSKWQIKTNESLALCISKWVSELVALSLILLSFIQRWDRRSLYGDSFLFRLWGNELFMDCRAFWLSSSGHASCSIFNPWLYSRHPFRWNLFGAYETRIGSRDSPAKTVSKTPVLPRGDH